MPFISVVIPIHNCENTIVACVNSVLGQSFKDCEIILVDDASTDDTLVIINENFGDKDNVRILSLPENVKGFAARNRGVEVASGEYIMFLDADDIYLPGSLEQVASAIAASNADILQFASKVKTEDAKIASGMESYLRPYPGVICGPEEIVNSCLSEIKFNWGLVNKAFKADVCKKALGHSDILGIHRGDDLLAFFEIMLLSSSYEGFPDIYLYQYNYGAGQSGKALIGVQRFSSLCDSYIVADILLNKLNELQAQETLCKSIDTTVDRLIDNCTSDFLNNLNPEYKAEGLEILFQKWGYERTLKSLIRKTPPEKISGLAKLIVESSVVNLKRKPIKCVGIVCQKFSTGDFGKLEYLTNAWLSMGHKVIWLLETQPDINDGLPGGIEVGIIPAADETSQKASVDRFDALSAHIASLQIDAIVFCYEAEETLIWDIFAAESMNASTIVSCQSGFAQTMRVGDPAFADIPYIYALADAIVATSLIDAEFWKNFNTNVFVSNGFESDRCIQEGSENKDLCDLWTKIFKQAPDASHMFQEGTSLKMWDVLLDSYRAGVESLRSSEKAQSRKAAKYKRRLEKTKKNLSKKNRQIKDMKSSYSWRIGRKLTAPIRRIKRLF